MKIKIYFLLLTILMSRYVHGFGSENNVALSVSLAGPTILCPVGTGTYTATLSGTNTCGSSLKYTWSYYPMPSRVTISAGGGVNDNFVTLKTTDSSIPVTNMSVIVSIYCGTTFLTSSSVQNISINDLRPPVVANVNKCGAGSVNLVATPNGTIIKWYDASTNGNLLASNGGPLGTPTTYTTPSANPGTTLTYYVSSFDPYHNCESTTRAPISAIINSIPDAPTGVTGNARFEAGNLTMTATGTLPSGGKFNWYNTSGQFLASGVSYTTASVIASNQSNYLSIKIASPVCESSALSVNVIIEPIPIITSTSASVIKGANVSLSATQAYTTYTWKNGVGGTVGTGATYATNSPGRYTLTVTKNGTSGTSVSLPFDLKIQYSGLNKNYVIANSLMSRTAADPTNSPVEIYSESVKYYDGLGRPTQVIAVQNSPLKNDFTQPIVYQGFDREALKYLPYVSSENNGWFKENALKDPAVTTGTDLDKYKTGKQYAFYQNSGIVAQDQFPYAETRYEQSSLNRVIEQGAPGGAWQPDLVDSYLSNDKTVKKDYQFNTFNEVIQFDYIAPSMSNPLGLVKIGKTAYYAANQLSKNYTKDEQGNEQIEFIDKNGKLILRRVQVDATSYAQTYYIYDDAGNLVKVLQPEASKAIINTLPITWDNKIGVTINANNTLTTSVSTYGNAGATSTVATETLAAGVDGWVETIANEITSSRMIGLAPSNIDAGTSILYAIELRSDGNIYIRDNSNSPVNVGGYKKGTVVRIAREATSIKYYVDGIYKQTSSTASTTALIVDAALGGTSATLSDVVISFKVNSMLPGLFSNFAFQYAYDSRNRMIQKQVPGAAAIYLVYDNRDRLVFTQDGNQRANKYWSFTKYDMLNRPVLTGIYQADSVLLQSKMQRRVNAYYAAVPGNGGAWFESYTGVATVHGYDNKSYPQETNADNYLSVTYYDNYTFRNNWPGTYKYTSDGLTTTVLTIPYNQFATENQQVVGQVTGSKIKVLDGGVRGGYTWLRSVSYYDDKYRVIQTQTDNYKGGKDKISNLYDFVGKILKTKETHTVTTWTDLVGVKQDGNKIIRTASASGWGGSGAASVQQLGAGQDGWVEFVASELNDYRLLGLSAVNADAGYTSIDYAWDLGPSNAAIIFEKGTNRGQFSYSLGDVFRIERVGTTISYYQNNVFRFSSTVPSSSSLIVDLSFYSINAELANIRTSFTNAARTITRTFDYDHAGRLLRTWHQVDNGTNFLLSKNDYNELGQLIDKKLHSTTALAADNKQSVDYRYNIRGWLTSMNNSQLTDDHAAANTNDDTGDLFGINLFYNTVDASLGSSALYNGNISGIKTSSVMSTTIKENGYTFSYDAMNRLTAANSRMNQSGTWQAGNYSEKITQYDLNGNIQKLQRWGDGGDQIDDLTYDYTGKGNQLQSVGDAASNVLAKIKGFADGNAAAGVEYSYDNNGNMTRDLNKGIGATISDVNSIITYNYMNLPEKVTKKGTLDYVQYIYTATGSKLAQIVSNSSASFKRTDYIGSFVYEQDALKYINHEEGRIVMQQPQLVFFNNGEDLNDLTTTSTATALTTLANNETYFSVASGTTIGDMSVTLNVAAGERYLFRAKGYTGGTTPVVLSLKVNNTTDMGRSSALPTGQTAEGWIEKMVVIPAGGNTLKFSLGWIQAPTNEIYYINEMEIERINPIAGEYQYNLKDHLGNVRVMFTASPIVETVMGTLESTNATTERGQFLRYDNARTVNHYFFDHTNGSSPSTTSGGAQRLSGVGNEIFGLARSLSVMPGDVIDMEVYGKYVDLNGTNSSALTTLISQIAAGTAPAGTVVDGGTYISSTSSFPVVAGRNGTGSSTGSGPKAFLNWLVFDKNYNLISSKSSYRRMSATPMETGNDTAHEKLSTSITIADPGYVYIYLSNEGGAGYEVYFDDFKVTQTKSAVISSNDYYPFGLTYNSYERENTVAQHFKYNAKEQQDELNLGWLDYGARRYMSDIGRWTAMDQLSGKYEMFSPYNYVLNCPTKNIDPDGKIVRDANGNVVVTSTGRSVTVAPIAVTAKPNANGTITITTIERVYEIVNIYADDGTPIEAMQLISATEVSSTVDKKKGVTINRVSKPVGMGYGGYECEADCHGFTFAEGQLWINNDWVDNILTGDGYNRKVSESKADAVVFRKKGAVVHSAKRNKRGTYDNDAGIRTADYNMSLVGAARSLTDVSDPANVEFLNKSTPNRVIDTELGTVKGKKRVITDTNEIMAFLQKLRGG